MNLCKKSGKKQTGMMSLTTLPGIRWTVDQSGIVLINENSGESCFAGYPEAALWDLMQRGYSFAKIVELFSSIIMENEAIAEEIAAVTFRRWIEQGFLSGVDHG